MGTNLITTEELLKLKEAEEQQKKYFTTEELMNMSIMSSAPKQDIQSQMTTPNTPEIGQEPAQKQESKIKDIWDSFKLGASGLIHDAKQFFTGTVPNYIFQDIKDSDRRYIENKFGLPEGTVTDELMHNVDKKHELIRENAQIKYDKAEENYQKWLEDHPELQPREEWSKGVLETIKENPAILLDPAYWGYVAAQSAAFSIGVMGTTALATALTGNPLIGMAAGTAIAYPSQAHGLYKALIESGATKEQAAELSVPLGAAIASVETIGDLPILGAISKPFKKMLTKNIKKEVVQSVVKSGIKTFLAAEASEVLEEIVQGAIQDATVKTFDENRDMLENIPETVIQTLIATAPMALFGGASQMRNTQNYNQILETESKKVQVIQEALDKLTGTEKDVDIIRGIESKFTEKGLEFGEKDYTNIKQQIEEKRPTDRPEIIPTSPDTKQPAPERQPTKLVTFTEEQLEKINKSIPADKDTSKGNLELDKRKLKIPVKEIVSQYIPDKGKAQIVENNINKQINNIIPRAEAKAPEMKLIQQEIKEIIQDEINNEIEIYHFSHKKIDVVDPLFMGENLTQAEKDRQENDPVSEKTSAFYTRESMPEEQFVAGPSLHKTKIDKDKLLDIRLPDNSKYITEQGNINETRIKEDGYMGYIAPIDRKAQVRLFEATPVQEMGIAQGSVKEGDALKPMWNIKSKIEPKAPDINIPQKDSDTKETVPLSNQEKQDVQKIKNPPRISEPEVGYRFVGTAWRGDSRLGGGAINARDIANFEGLELGNEAIIEDMEEEADKHDIDLSKVPAEDITWVTKKKSDADEYGNAKKYPLSKDNLVVAYDPDGGFLVIDNVSKYIGTGAISEQEKQDIRKRFDEAVEKDYAHSWQVFQQENSINNKLNKQTGDGETSSTGKITDDTREKGPMLRGATKGKKGFIWEKALEERQKRQQEEQGQVVQQEEQGQVVQQEEQGQAVQQEEQGQKTQTAQKQEIDFEDTSQTGKEGTHKLAERAYLGAIANEIETGLSTEELQKYKKTDMLNNSERAIDFVNKNYKKAVDILLNGGEAYDSQGHILKGGIFAAVRNAATLSGDSALIRLLATNSHVSRESRFMGAYIKSFDEMGQYDAVSAIKKLHEHKSREAQKRIKNFDKLKQEEINKIEDFIKLDIEKFKKKLKDVFGNKDIHC